MICFKTSYQNWLFWKSWKKKKKLEDRVSSYFRLRLFGGFYQVFPVCGICFPWFLSKNKSYQLTKQLRRSLPAGKAGGWGCTWYGSQDGRIVGVWRIEVQGQKLYNLGWNYLILLWLCHRHVQLLRFESTFGNSGVGWGVNTIASTRLLARVDYVVY